MKDDGLRGRGGWVEGWRGIGTGMVREGEQVKRLL